ncbi:alpha-galactosidase [Bacillus ginsengihumi]|uniref:Alpha-galactosidase n=1 Tax=Heyndrickxia ginsengihumi TaxID=363870 RepID=A0A6M0PAW9_9BACI|nr:alpha-galactosidase [Heyndrickxia ginsengihumi]NEY21050.1 alpha-galactosidase [Heyndrickxia ginsengihumi]
MAIRINKKNKEFHLYNDQVSYIFRVLEKCGQLEQVYYGKKVHHRSSFKHLIEREPHTASCNMFEHDDTSSLEFIKQEYPSYGTTDFRSPAYAIINRNGSHVTNFQYIGYRLFQGKRKLTQLPATYVEEYSEADTLEITLYDYVLQAKLIVSYTIYNRRNVITRHVTFVNEGRESFYIDTAMSASVDFPDDVYEMVYLNGAWGREAHIQTVPLAKGVQSIASARGASSHQFNPFLALKRPETTEHSGEVYGFSLVYSGNFLAQAEVDSFHTTRVMLGINPFQFKWKLAQGEIFQTPECVMVYSDRGLNGMSQTYHDLYRKRLVRGYWRDQNRPILINNWEATYFNFTEDSILKIAKEAQRLGIELFVLDDGWFGKRNNAKSSLGDWYVNKEKLPNGIKGLSEKITALGMKFGLWFEPEMVCKDSRLYERHPDWVLSTPNRPMSHGRNQYVLDFSREEVVETIFNLMCKVIDDAQISYIKWDMNRNITEAYSLGLSNKHQGELFHRYILGVYKLYEKLIERFPEILFESCASGGGRFDPGLLYYAPQTWTSDDTDAIERLYIQYGTSLVYPINSMGSHVSAVPNHQIGRITPLETRANVAYFGTFGYELDVTTLSDTEKQQVKQQIEFFKKKSRLISTGTFYRLVNPKDNDHSAWMIVSENQSEAIVGYYRILVKPNDGYRRIKLDGLHPNKRYAVSGKEGHYYGSELMNIGLILNNNHDVRNKQKPKDFSSELFIITEIH